MGADVFLKFEHDERDIVNGVRLRLAGRLRSGALVLASSAVASGLVAALARPWGVYAGSGLFGVTFVGAMLAAVRAAPASMFRAGPVEKTRADALEPEGFRDPTITVDASEDGVAVTVGRRLANIRWDECVRLDSDARCYVLHFGARGFLVVPRRAFRNEKRDAAFRELVTSCMEHAASPVATGTERAEAAEEAGETPHAEEPPDAEPALPEQEAVAPPAAVAPRVGRNDPCPCGSGKKYKKCCLGGADDAT